MRISSDQIRSFGPSQGYSRSTPLGMMPQKQVGSRACAGRTSGRPLERSSGGAPAQKRVAARAAGYRKTGDDITREILRFRDQRFIIRPLGNSRTAIKTSFKDSQSVRDIGASIASGSFPTRGMIVAPCSMRTLAAIAHCQADNLMVRSADVHLKERRPLVRVARETPLHLGNLRAMVATTEAGPIVMPPAPAFYLKPASVAEIIEKNSDTVLLSFHFTGAALDDALDRLAEPPP
ncbi:UbiX family flavin prenyltransferase [Rhodoblastus sp. 17X3]|uniref:UbiX family flavin prenyltransferase n=1 Tax=Rhodoblastus sp. 17X3 TaxID=3047026 RepID=UPI0024B79242|nr:UbiX family flavin prenyltransferase [Rhodoblastus sp. 17X3]MDI9850156.1 UbiX family flavin prenyltransferase [Rhodoblastus sp. 17X3]